jgi:hypothetical protein
MVLKIRGKRRQNIFGGADGIRIYQRYENKGVLRCSLAFRLGASPRLLIQERPGAFLRSSVKKKSRD